jgi:hypothetical protein
MGPGHNEKCAQSAITFRHNAVTHAIADSLRTIKGTNVILEPPIAGSANLRNDIRLTALQTSSITSVDIDVSVVSIHANAATGGARPGPQETMAGLLSRASTAGEDFPPVKRGKQMLASVLQRATDAKNTKNSPYTAHNPTFLPFIITARGAVDEHSPLLAQWKSALSPFVYANLIKKLSIILVRSAARGA